MPTKSKKSGDDREESMSSEASVGHSSEASTLTVSSEVLERILATNARTFLEASKVSMTALIAALPSSVATFGLVSGSTSRTAHIKTPKWTDEENTYEYFTKYEKAMTHNKVAKSEWGHLLPVYLSGRDQASFSQVGEDMLDDYELVKETMLESLGDTPASADRCWWTINRHTGKAPGAFYLRVCSTGLRRLHGLRSRDEVVERTILSSYLSLLSQECYTSVVAKGPKDELEAARLVQEFEETRGFARRHQPWRNTSAGQHNQSSNRGPNDHGYKRAPANVKQHGSAGGGSNSNSADSGNSHGGNTRTSSPQENASSSQASGGRSSRSERQGQNSRKLVTCFGCGDEQGHIRPNCPNRVRQVSSPGQSSIMLVNGSLAGQPARNLRIDTGADRTVIRQDYVPEVAYTGKSCMLDTWRGSQASRHRLACITVKVGSVEVTSDVAVAESLDCLALLGADLGEDVTIALMQHIIAESAHKKAEPLRASPSLAQTNVPVSSGQSVSVGSGSVPIRATRASTAKELAEIEADDEASAQLESQPIDLLNVVDLPESYFEDDPEPTPVEALCTLLEGGVMGKDLIEKNLLPNSRQTQLCGMC